MNQENPKLETQNSKQIRNFRNFSLLGVVFFLFAASVFAAETAKLPVDIQIESIQPKRIYVSISGQQNSAVIRGKNLEKIHTLKVFLKDKAVPHILGQLGKADDSTRSIFFVAAPNTEFSDEYKVYGITKDKQIFLLPMELEVVAADDPRGNPISIEEMTKGKGEFAKGVISVDVNQAPVVIKTIPDPLIIKSTGELQEVILRGRNLEKITEIRLRPAERKKYIGNSGIIPFEKDGGDLRLKLSATSDTPSGAKYCLDLIMGRFIAGTLTFEIIAEPIQPLLKPPTTDAESASQEIPSSE